jgi:hypothetical protein
MSVRNRKNPPPPPKSADLAGNYRMIGISAVKAAARYGGSCKGPREPTKGPKTRDSTESYNGPTCRGRPSLCDLDREEPAPQHHAKEQHDQDHHTEGGENLFDEETETEGDAQ